MILNTGMRTDIPAYYSDWFYNRIREGFVLTRNPYYPQQVTRYRLSPDVVDCLCFCTKNPEPMLARMAELDRFRQFWFVTINDYGRETEPYVPDTERVTDAFCRLSEHVGAKAVGWRYDPVFLTEQYDPEFHIRSFAKIAEKLSGHTGQCVISFLDLYEKTKRNFPQAKEVSRQEQKLLAEAFVRIGERYGIRIYSCCEDAHLAEVGVDVSGCMTKPVLERAIGLSLDLPKKKTAREGCGCLLGSDIGMYNTCGHGCIYCYANYDCRTVEENMRQHDPASPFLIGGYHADDQIRDAKQETYTDGQLSLALFGL